jgi:hypothetical protein
VELEISVANWGNNRQERMQLALPTENKNADRDERIAGVA